MDINGKFWAILKHNRIFLQEKDDIISTEILLNFLRFLKILNNIYLRGKLTYKNLHKYLYNFYNFKFNLKYFNNKNDILLSRRVKEINS